MLVFFLRRLVPGVLLAALAPSVPAAAVEEEPGWMGGSEFAVVLSIDEVDDMRWFYGDVLGLETLDDFFLSAHEGQPSEGALVRFRVGTSEVRMVAHEDLFRAPGGRAEATGLRMLSLPLSHDTLIDVRLSDLGLEPLDWEEAGDYRVAFLRDPDGNEVELRRYPASADEEDTRRLEVVLNASDVEAARRTYRDGLLLPELPPTDLVGFDGPSYRYVAGEATLRVWSSGEPAPAAVGRIAEGFGLRHLQFPVEDASEAQAGLVERGVAIVQGPTPLDARTTLLFAADPDGVIIELVGPGPESGTREPLPR